MRRWQHECGSRTLNSHKIISPLDWGDLCLCWWSAVLLLLPWWWQCHSSPGLPVFLLLGRSSSPTLREGTAFPVVSSVTCLSASFSLSVWKLESETQIEKFKSSQFCYTEAVIDLCLNAIQTKSFYRLKVSVQSLRWWFRKESSTISSLQRNSTPTDLFQYQTCSLLLTQVTSLEDIYQTWHSTLYR